MARIRGATPADVEALIRMGAAMHAESPRYRDRPFDPEKLRALPDRLGACGAIVVAEHAGELVGLFVGFASEDWFGPTRFATDLAVYVTPAHRGGTAFIRLVAAAEEWATALGLAEINIGVSTGVHVERTVCAYEKLGYTLLDTRVVTKKLTHVHRT